MPYRNDSHFLIHSQTSAGWQTSFKASEAGCRDDYIAIPCDFEELFVGTKGSFIDRHLINTMPRHPMGRPASDVLSDLPLTLPETQAKPGSLNKGIHQASAISPCATLAGVVPTWPASSVYIDLFTQLPKQEHALRLNSARPPTAYRWPLSLLFWNPGFQQDQLRPAAFKRKGASRRNARTGKVGSAAAGAT